MKGNSEQARGDRCVYIVEVVQFIIRITGVKVTMQRDVDTITSLNDSCQMSTYSILGRQHLTSCADV